MARARFEGPWVSCGEKNMLLFVLAVSSGLWQIAGNCRVKFCPGKRTSGGELKVNVLSPRMERRISVTSSSKKSGI